MPFFTYNIHDMLDAGGRDDVSTLLKGFSCPLNQEIHDFVAKNAVEFALRKISVTYFVMNSLNEIVGFFTLTHKPSFISLDLLGSKTMRRKLERHCSGFHMDESFFALHF